MDGCPMRGHLRGTSGAVPPRAWRRTVSQVARLTYPVPRRVDQVDDYHGVSVQDPYRWMEDLSDPDLPAWLDAQAELTAAVLSAVPERERFHAFLSGMRGQTKDDSTPTQKGGRWFSSRYERADAPGGLYVADGPEGPWRLVLPTTGRGKHVVISDIAISPDASKVLFVQTVGGSDWRNWRVVDVETAEELCSIEGAKLWAHWLPDSSGFLWTGFEGSGTDPTRPTTSPQLRLHRLDDGSAPDGSDDELVYERPESPTYFFASTTEDAKIVLLKLMGPGYEVLVSPSGAPPAGTREWRSIIASDDSLWVIGTRGNTLYVTTTEDAPYGRCVAIDLEGDTSPAGWRTVVPEGEHPLHPIGRTVLVGDWVIAARDHLGQSFMSAYRLDGTDSYEIELPWLCRFAPHDITQPPLVSEDGTTFTFSVTRPTSPRSTLCHNVTTRETTVVDAGPQAASFDVVAEVQWATSADGTQVPMTIVRSAEHAHVPNPPAVIEGYGGAGDSMEPYDFVPWKVAWLDAGGAVVSAHIRGGLELGIAWQTAALRGGKKLAAEDFVACGEQCVLGGLTTADRVAVSGRSSGAMLAAAATLMKPEAFGACFAAVGMFDPLRYHLFGLGSLMVSEYGCSDDPDDFAAMISYSPQHNVKEGVAYPAFLLTVHTDDDRVAPGQPFKFLSELQRCSTGDAPLLLRIREGAGHHGGSPEGEIDEWADVLAFYAATIGTGR
jgi:prolyl oligopeptidase